MLGQRQNSPIDLLKVRFTLLSLVNQFRMLGLWRLGSLNAGDFRDILLYRLFFFLNLNFLPFLLYPLLYDDFIDFIFCLHLLDFFCRRIFHWNWVLDWHRFMLTYRFNSFVFNLKVFLGRLFYFSWHSLFMLRDNERFGIASNYKTRFRRACCWLLVHFELLSWLNRFCCWLIDWLTCYHFQLLDSRSPLWVRLALYGLVWLLRWLQDCSRFDLFYCRFLISVLDDRSFGFFSNDYRLFSMRIITKWSLGFITIGAF